MIKNIVILALILLILYLYYQQRKPQLLGNPSDPNYQQEVSETVANLREEKKDLETNLDQALVLQEANQQKLTEQFSEINFLKNRLQVYERVGASTSGESNKLKAVLDEQEELKRTNQNLELANEKLTEDLNSILTKWKWGNWRPKSAQEFINKFDPWIDGKAQQEKEIKELKKEIKSLEESKETSPAVEELETERDEAIRDKQSLEQDLTAINNRLNLKNQEVKNREQDLERLKKEFSEKDKSLNKQIKDLQTKYTKQSKLLDTEQLESKRLEEEKEKLETKITELEKERSSLINSDEELTEFEEWLAEEKAREENLPEWDTILEELKTKKKNFYSDGANWKSSWLKGNSAYWQVFQKWLEEERE
jgi:chromosome segregation ATPase